MVKAETILNKKINNTESDYNTKYSKDVHININKWANEEINEGEEANQPYKIPNDM